MLSKFAGFIIYTYIWENQVSSMKKHIVLIPLAILLGIMFSCKEKNSNNAIRPGYGATGNPYPEQQTVTGSTTYTSPATKNTSLRVGDIGWSNPSCISTGSTALRATKGDIDVILSFSGPVTSNTYAIAGTPGVGSCALTLSNAPDQPAGVFWYAKSGSVVVTTTSTSINANLIGVVCTQKEFNFPQVVVSGVLGCSQ